MMSLTRLLRTLSDGGTPSLPQTRFLLTRRNEELGALCAAARALRAQHHGRGIGLYGFIYLSTHCRNNCAFCLYQRDNADMTRYRKTAEEVVAIGRRLARDGVHVLDLTLGEDPHWLSPRGFADLCRVVATLKRETSCAVMLSPGLLHAPRMAHLTAAGADWYACYQETHNKALFAQLRPEQRFSARVRARRTAAHLGMLVEDGLLTGAGATTDMLAKAVLLMRREPLAQVRAMRYVPHARTLPVVGSVSGLQGDSTDEPAQELALMATMRMLMPQRHIPASLDVDGLDGLAVRLDAGADVVTSIVPAGQGLAGVASETLDIGNHRRSAAAVCAELARLDLEPLAATAAQRFARPDRTADRRTQGGASLCA